MRTATRRATGARADLDADVIVVGAGPAGATAAAYLARAGLDVLVCEKSSFPREKVCGDGLTPRGTKELIDLGIDTSIEAGWLRNTGLRVYGGGLCLELAWPDLASYPPYGLVRTRHDFDEMLARHAQKAGARLHEQTSVTEAITDGRGGRIVGVAAKRGPDRAPVTYRAPLTLACDGASSPVARSLGMERRDDRPMGVAVRRYYHSPRTHDDYLESHLELWDRTDPDNPTLMPGYGWIFGMGDGTSNVGLGALSTSKSFRSMNYRTLLRSWLDGTPQEWGLREHNAAGRIGGAALPMAFNRAPAYRNGVLLVGDAGGMVNPFNGEGIPYAMHSARIAAECAAHALARPQGPAREHALARYTSALQQTWGGYFRLGSAFSKLIGNPGFMQVSMRHALPRATLMRFALKLLANLYDDHSGDAHDRVITAMTRLTPTA